MEARKGGPVILTELEEHVIVVLDDALEVVLGDHEDPVLGLDLGEGDRGQAERRQAEPDDGSHPESEHLFVLFPLSVRSPPAVLFSRVPCGSQRGLPRWDEDVWETGDEDGRKREDNTVREEYAR